MEDKLLLLDCTLRDGGFINDWEFGHETIVNIFERAVSAGTDIIEIGFIDERRALDINRTIMPDGSAVEQIFAGLDHGKAMVVGMIDYGTCSIDRILPCSESLMDGIRVIFKKKNRFEAIDFCGKLKEKGYKVFVQPVSITGYSDSEMENLVDMVNDLSPYAMSLVDTYGLLHEGGLMHYYDIMDSRLNPHISMGYHAHNNFQLGYSNSIALMEKNAAKPFDRRRTLVIDASSFGMGKGAGNSPIELVAMYMNNHFGKCYDISQMLETIDVSIMEIYLQSPWGYSLKYFLAASNDCHPNYVQHLMQKRTLSVKSINEILDSIAPDEKLAYNAEHIERLYENYQKIEVDDRGDLARLSKDLLQGGEILILGPGGSIKSEEGKIQSYMASKKPTVIAINYIPENLYADYVFISNAKRYVTLEGAISRNSNSVKLIATSNITPTKGSFDYVVDYAGLIDESFEFKDSALVMLLKLMVMLGAKKVTLAGFDGYSRRPGDNFFNMAMEYAFVKDKAEMLNEYMSNALGILSKEIEIEFVTETKYKF